MKLLACFGLLWLSLVSVALGWTKEDHEIFDLVSALQAAEGKGTTFYSFLAVSPSASATEIGRAYRKKSISMHPDKNPGVKDIEKRFARLGVIAKILRTKEDRERYDFFYKNGVPVWRGTGYYYERFRPGLGTVFVFLAVLSSLVQFVIAKVNNVRDVERVDRLSKAARILAYGPKGVPVAGKRKVRVPLSGEVGTTTNKSPGERSEPGKLIDMIVDGENVFLVGGPGEEPIPWTKEEVAPEPKLIDTWLPALGISLYKRLAAQAQGSKSSAVPASETTADDAKAEGYVVVDGNGSSEKSEPKKRKNAGGKRKP